MEPFKLPASVERNVDVTVTEVHRHEASAFVAIMSLATVNNDVITNRRDRSHHIIVVE
jgi:hypothetical protein